MRVVHVLRKPCSEGTVASNTLKHGCGGLNIDRCRIGVEGGSATPSGMDRFNARLAEQGYRPDSYTQGAPPPPPPSGRWPANLILEHLKDCVQTGTRRVSTDGHWPASRGRGSDICGATGHKGQEGLVEHYAQSEVTEAWACEEGCPVAGLNEQSGSSSSPKTYHRKSPGFNSSVYGIGMGEPSGKDSLNYGDKGGASRFFKQVGFKS